MSVCSCRYVEGERLKSRLRRGGVKGEKKKASAEWEDEGKSQCAALYK